MSQRIQDLLTLQVVFGHHDTKMTRLLDFLQDVFGHHGTRMTRSLDLYKMFSYIMSQKMQDLLTCWEKAFTCTSCQKFQDILTLQDAFVHHVKKPRPLDLFAASFRTSCHKEFQALLNAVQDVLYRHREIMSQTVLC